MFVFLPLAHVFARTCCNAAIKTGNCTSFTRSIENEMMTPTFKLKKNTIIRNYKAAIDKMYC